MTHFIKIKMKDDNGIYIRGFLAVLAVFLSFFYLYLIDVRLQNDFLKNEIIGKLNLTRNYHQETELNYIRELALVGEKQREYGFVKAGEVKFVSVEEKDLARAHFFVNP